MDTGAEGRARQVCMLLLPSWGVFTVTSWKSPKVISVMHLFRVFTILCDHVVLQSSLPAWELPVSQGFKQQVTSMNCAMFHTSLLPHFLSPTLRAELAVTGGSAPGSAAGWPWAVQVLQSSPLLQRMQCLQVGFGTDKEETSALRCCCCSAL